MEDDRRKPGDLPSRRPSGARLDPSRESKPFSRHGHSAPHATPICKFFLKGHCNRGSACSYLHPTPEEVSQVTYATTATTTADLKHGKSPLSNPGLNDPPRRSSPSSGPLLRKPHAFDKQASESWGLPGPTIDPTDGVSQGGSLSSPVLASAAAPVSLVPAWLSRRRSSKSSGLSASVVTGVPLPPAASTQLIPPSNSSSSLGSAASTHSSHLNWEQVEHQVGDIGAPGASPTATVLGDSVIARGPQMSWNSVHTQSTQSSASSSLSITTSKSATSSTTNGSSTSRDSHASYSSSSSYSSGSSHSNAPSGGGSIPAPRISKRMNTGTMLQKPSNHASSQTDLSLLGGSLSNLHRGAKKFHDKLSMMRWIQTFTGSSDPSSILLQRADLEELLMQPSLPFTVISELMKIFAHPEFRGQGHTDRVLQIVAESPLIRNPKNLKAYLIKLSGASAPATYAYQENLSNVLDVIGDIMERFPQFVEILGLDLLQISSAKISACYPKAIYDASQALIGRGKELLGGPSTSLPTSSAASLAFSSDRSAPMANNLLLNLSRQLDSLGESSTDDSDGAESDDGSYGSTDSDPEDSSEDFEDFRRLPLFPTIQEIMADSTDLGKRLNRNITKGKYESLTHYLDTHFRLLREDAITSIREGIKSWREDEPKKEKATGKQKPSEVSFYHSVRLAGICPTPSGIVHRMAFRTDPLGPTTPPRKTPTAPIDWLRSQRLLYGSLLCLSHDDFRTLIWATVANRDAALLSLSQEIDVKFAEDSSFSLDPSLTYTMVESTSTYFEAYRHVLGALKTTSLHTIPFVDYLVRCNTSVESPAYLRNGSSIYSMKSIFGPEANDFDVLSDWPSLPTTMDQSQLNAVKNAITKEVSVIQGPPGTGKTFVGLKVMRALLDNRDARGLGSNGPILVVCFTNHALDQFLEGIMEFEPNVVRIGSRSKSELLKDRNLKSLLYEMNLTTIGHSKTRKQMATQLKELREEIESRFADLSRALLSSSDIFAAASNEDHDEDDDPLISSLFGKSLGIDSAAEALVIGNWLGCDPSEILRDRATDRSSKPLSQSSTLLEADFPSLSAAFASGAPVTPSSAKATGNWEESSLHEDLLHDGDQEDEWEERREEWFDKFDAGFSLKITRVAPDSALSGSPDLQKLPAAITDCHNAWKLTKPDRQRLYLYWLDRFRKHVIMPDLVDMCARYEHLCQQKQVVDQDTQIQLLMSASVIGLTTTGVAKFQKLIRAVGPPIVVVEEAAEVLEAHIVTAITPSTKQLILIGDHEQLRPSTAVHRLAVKFGLDVSLFERLINNGFPVHSLSRQRRMRPQISALLHSIYPQLSDHPDVLTRPHVQGVGSNVYFIDHSQLEGADSDQGVSKQNPHEASFLGRLAAHLIYQGYQESQITILTAYSGQVKLIRQELRARNLSAVYVTSVDNYQGQEADIICLSLVRSNPQGSIGFLSTSNRICVALSRARIGLYVIGNASQLEASQNPTWRFVLAQLRSQAALGPELVLRCQNHPEKAAAVSSVEHFEHQCADGGCDLPCTATLHCGHACPRRCHPFPHSSVTCLRPCEHVFPDCGHKCTKRCFQDCGLCEVPVKRVLHCGHECTSSCSDDLPPCQQQVLLTLPCAHSVTALCMHVNPSPASHRAPRTIECPKCTNSAPNM